MAPKRSRDESASARLPRTEKTSADCFTATLAAHPILVLAHARLESARRLSHQPPCRIRRLTQGMTLPCPTSFSKHLPLQFQFIHPRVYAGEIDRDRMYRVVQASQLHPRSSSILYRR
ncbi:hypothetical protein OG21DRAFT_1514886 [Imleria badia]|nr:hypothetical protein OG21DRAFT_1514886 [Imleria badia]